VNILFVKIGCAQERVTNKMTAVCFSCSVMLTHNYLYFSCNRCFFNYLCFWRNSYCVSVSMSFQHDFYILNRLEVVLLCWVNMTAIKHALQRDVFTPNDERLLGVVHIGKVGGKKKKSSFLCASGMLKKQAYFALHYDYL